MRTLLRILLFPVWMICLLVLGLALLGVKVIVGLYSILRGFFVLAGIILIAATFYCYHDYVQIAFLASLLAISFVILLAGTMIEVGLECACKGVLRMI